LAGAAFLRRLRATGPPGVSTSAPENQRYVV